MGYADPMRFEPAELALLDATKRSRSRPRDRMAPPIGRPSGSSSTVTTPSSDRSTARPRAGTARRSPTRRSRSTPTAGAVRATAVPTPTPPRPNVTDALRAQVHRDHRSPRDAGAGHLRRRRSGSTPPDAGAAADLEPRPHVLRRIQASAPRHRSGRDRGLAHLARPGRRAGRRDARALPHLQAAQARAPAADRSAAADPDALHQHDQPRAGAVVPRRRGARAPDPAADPLERGGDGPARQQPVLGDRRPPRHVCLGGDALRGRLQPLLPGQGRRRQRRPDLLPGSRRARDLCARLPRGPA